MPYKIKQYSPSSQLSWFCVLPRRNSGAEMAAVRRTPLTFTSIVNSPNNSNRNVGQPYKLNNIQSVATAPADDIRLNSTRLRFSHFEAPVLPFSKFLCSSTSLLNSNSSSSSSSSVGYGTKRAFISVSNKSELAFLGSGLHNLGFTIVSTGGTALCLENNGVPVTRLEHLTSFPELFHGPVKALHSSMGAGTLARRDSEHLMESLKDFRIETFDVVVLNFDPYSLAGGVQHEEGPELVHFLQSFTLLILAKIYKKVLPVVDPQDYWSLLEYLKGEQENKQFRHKLAKKAIQHEIMRMEADFF